MNKLNIIRATTLAAGVAGVLALTVPVSASPHTTAAHAARGGSVTGRGGALLPTSTDHAIGRITTANSRYFAGYQAAVTAGSATVSAASFTVPALSCTTATRAIGPVAGVDANNSKTFSSAFLYTGCVNGQAVNYPALVINGSETNYTTTPLSAGDVINLTTKVSTNRTRVQVTDVTTGVTEKLLGPGASASDAYFGDSAWFDNGALLHVPDFGKLTFKNCLIDGKALASWHPYATQRVNSLGKVQIATGGMWPGGTAFTTHFQHS